MDFGVPPRPIRLGDNKEEGVCTAIGLAAPVHADPDSTSGDDAGFCPLCSRWASDIPAQFKPTQPANQCAAA
jgi:hypothetical protein